MEGTDFLQCPPCDPLVLAWQNTSLKKSFETHIRLENIEKLNKILKTQSKECVMLKNI